jgi:hypothetical protein
MTNDIGQLIAGLLAIPLLAVGALVVVFLFERGGRRY